MRHLTVEEIKEALPTMGLKFNDKVYAAKVSGRRNKFATLTSIENHNFSVKVSWQCVTRCFNDCKPVLA